MAVGIFLISRAHAQIPNLDEVIHNFDDVTSLIRHPDDITMQNPPN